MGRYLFGGSSLFRVLDGKCEGQLIHHRRPYPGDWVYGSELSVKNSEELVLQKKGGLRKIGTQRVTGAEGCNDVNSFHMKRLTGNDTLNVGEDYQN